MSKLSLEIPSFGNTAENVICTFAKQPSAFSNKSPYGNDCFSQFVVSKVHTLEMWYFPQEADSVTNTE